MNNKALCLAVGMAIAYPSAGLALGLGEIESQSNLNQPFKATIDLLSIGNANPAQIRARVASASIFSRVGIERPAYLNSLRFRPGNNNGRPVLYVSSTQPIKEPFINFLIEVSWPNGQLLKEYTVLLDPPVLMQAGSSIDSNTVGVRPEPVNTLPQPTQQRQQDNAANFQQQQQQQRQRVIAQQQRQQQAQQQQRQRQLQQQQRQQQLQQQQRQQAQQQRQQQAQQQQRQQQLQQQRQAAQAAQNANRTYRVRSGDTLSKVARKLGYAGVRNEQMVVALYQANPTAFRRRNMNNLKRGVVMRRPSVNEARRISLSDARSEIRSQASEWKQRKARAQERRIAATQQQAPRTPQQQVTGNGNDNARMEVLGSLGGDSNATGSLAGAAKVEAVNRQLTLASESLAAKRSENNELKSRVSELESLLRKKNRLITLRNEQLAELQAALTQKGIAAPTVPTTAAVDDDLITEIPGDDDQVQQQGEGIQGQLAETNAPSGDILRDEGMEDPNAIISDPNQPQIFETQTLDEPSTQIDTALNQINEPEPEGGILDLLTSPLALGLGAGSLLALVLGFLFLRRRGETDDFDEYSPIDFDDPELSPGDHDNPADITTRKEPTMGFDDGDDPFADPGASDTVSSFDDLDFDEPDSDLADVDSAETSSSAVAKSRLTAAAAGTAGVAATAASARDSDQAEDDILQEADVYIVYGLHEQAETELKKVIEKDPENLEYRAKLLENYNACEDRDGFEREATEFAKMDGPNKAELWEKVSDWGRRLLPSNPLFAGPGIAAASATGGAATDSTDAGDDKGGGLGLGALAAGAAAVGGIAVTAGKAFADKGDDALDGVKDAGSGLAGAAGDLKDNLTGNIDVPDQIESLDVDSDFGDLDKMLDGGVAEKVADVPDLADVSVPDTDFGDLDSMLGGDDVDASEAVEKAGDTLDFESMDLDEMLRSDDSDKSNASASVEAVADSDEFDFSSFDSTDDLAAKAADIKDEASGAVGEVAGLDTFDFDNDLSDVDGLLDQAKDKKDGLVDAAKSKASDVANLNLELDGSDEGLGKILPQNSVYKSSEKMSAAADTESGGGNDLDDLSFLDLGDDSGDLMEAQISTKLDLARAYMDMGDVDGARSTLEEVMMEGNDDQRREAEELLHQTG